MNTLTVIAAVVFSLAYLMNFAQGKTLVRLFVLQALTVVAALYILAFSEQQIWYLSAGLLVLFSKALLVPMVLKYVIRKEAGFAVLSSRFMTPISLLSLACATFFAAFYLAPRIPHIETIPGTPLLIAALFASLYFLVNRRGGIVTPLSILSTQNAAILLAAYLAVPSLLLFTAILVSTVVWTLIARSFLRSRSTNWQAPFR
jgi:hydrogenase-4 membrane subunit HyfE